MSALIVLAIIFGTFALVSLIGDAIKMFRSERRASRYLRRRQAFKDAGLPVYRSFYDDTH